MAGTGPGVCEGATVTEFGGDEAHTGGSDGGYP